MERQPFLSFLQPTKHKNKNCVFIPRSSDAGKPPRVHRSGDEAKSKLNHHGHCAPTFTVNARHARYIRRLFSASLTLAEPRGFISPPAEGKKSWPADKAHSRKLSSRQYSGPEQQRSLKSCHGFRHRLPTRIAPIDTRGSRG